MCSCSSSLEKHHMKTSVPTVYEMIIVTWILLSKKQILDPSCCKIRQVPVNKLVWGIGEVWRFWMIPNWSQMSMSDSLKYSGLICYHSEPSDVFYSPYQFLGWDFFCRFLQQGGSRCCTLFARKILIYASKQGTELKFRQIAILCSVADFHPNCRHGRRRHHRRRRRRHCHHRHRRKTRA